MSYQTKVITKFVIGLCKFSAQGLTCYAIVIRITGKTIVLMKHLLLLNHLLKILIGVQCEEIFHCVMCVHNRTPVSVSASLGRVHLVGGKATEKM